MNNILRIILENKKKMAGVLKKNRDALLSLAKKAPRLRSFKDAIRREGKLSLIAELKKASPSSGVLREDFSLSELARRMSEAGANALSVLTEEDFFLGKINYIEEVKKVVDIPVLRKDFIIDESQILESRAAGADAILLIARILDNKKLGLFYEQAKELGMDVIVEIHTEKELKRVLSLSCDIIGINNRNLDTLRTDLSTTEKLLPFIPADTVVVSESGIKEFKDVLWLKGLGVNAILVGEAIMRSPLVEEKIKELHIDG